MAFKKKENLLSSRKMIHVLPNQYTHNALPSIIKICSVEYVAYYFTNIITYIGGNDS